MFTLQIIAESMDITLCMYVIGGLSDLREEVAIISRVPMSESFSSI